MSLPSQLLDIGKHRIHIAEVDSTNTYAQSLLSKSKPVAGTAITASYQTAGRGQIGRYWYSSSGKNALCSIILYPSVIEANKQFWLSVVVSCAVRSVIALHIPDKEVSIKWPNDIYVGDLKIAGLLLQNTLKGNKINNTIVGIGVNVNEPIFPKEIPNPTSLFIVKNGLTDLDLFYKDLFEAVAKYYQLLMFQQFDKLKSEYLNHLYAKGISKSYKLQNGEVVNGIIQDVTEQGKLIVSIGNRKEEFAFREIGLEI